MGGHHNVTPIDFENGLQAAGRCTATPYSVKGNYQASFKPFDDIALAVEQIGDAFRIARV